MPILSTFGAGSFAGLRGAASLPQARGGGGGAEGDNNTYPGSFDSSGGHDSTLMNYNVGTGPFRIQVIGGGGGGSNYARGGSGGYAEAYVSAADAGTGYADVVIGAGGAAGANGGVGGGLTYITFISTGYTIAAGGGGGGGGQTATVGDQGTNTTVGSAGETGDATNAGDGGDSFISSALTYQVEHGTTGYSGGWSGDRGHAGIIGGAGDNGRVILNYNA